MDKYLLIQKLLRSKNLKNMSQFVKIPFKYAMLLSVVLVVICVCIGIIPVIQVRVVSSFVDIAINSVEVGKLNKSIYLSIIALMVLVASDWISNSIIKLLTIKMKLKLKSTLRVELIGKCARLKYKYVENGETWDKITRVCGSPEEFITNNYLAIIQLVSLLISIIGVVVIIMEYVWWAALMIILFCTPLFYLSYKSGKASYKVNKTVSKLERMYWYLSWLLTGRECSYERNLFNYSREINRRYNETYDKAFSMRLKSNMKWMLKTKLGGVGTSLAMLLVILILVIPVSQGRIGSGVFIALITAIFSLTSKLSWGLSSKIDTLVNGVEYIKDMQEFNTLEEDSKVTAVPYFKSTVRKIEFRNVTFKYPYTEKIILNNVSFILNERKSYAFVGENGAGKTTIIKLLTGLYDEYDGEIFINDKEIREYSGSELKGFFSIVYQDFVKYNLSISDNCAIGNVADYNGEEQYSKIIKAIEAVGLDKKVDSCEKKAETLLGKIYDDGIDLSGGEWQKLAIARALISPASVRILDEPTAALDPISESDIYKMFDDISRDKLTICISHRLGSTINCDEILVLDNGIIIENGSFEALINMRGKYYEMYQQQKSWYKTE